ncbi:trans-aconitate 2-methyltransferase [Kitasatospora sp. GAS1066B]|uniref:class I SAM-dependent methyltransferase n=1 Tax=Kitasatospora sp. GAS1066B TaxID=3156271 RepID=UPI0035119D25
MTHDREPAPADLELPPAPEQWARDFFDQGFETTFRALGKYDTTTADLDALGAQPFMQPGASILDVPCGFGRHAGPLTERGYQVTGIDASAEQIDQARQRHPKATFAQADMRTPPPGPFDVVLNLWTSFGYLDTPSEDQQALTAWASALNPGGHLVMELTTRERAEYENRRAAEPISTKSVTHEGVTEDAWYDWEARIAHVRYTRPGWSRTCRTRMYSRPELHAMLTAAGFSTVTFTGDFAGGPVQPQNRTVVLATTPTQRHHL